jgi:hypothetical protein
MPSEGAKWGAKLAKGLKKIANSIAIQAKVAGTPCPGATDPDAAEFDPKADRAYHAANPSAPVCVNGRVGATVSQRTVLGFHIVSLTDSEREFLGIGALASNEAILITGNDQNLTGIFRYRDPTNSNQWYTVYEGFPRTIPLNNVRIFYYAKSVKE